MKRQLRFDDSSNVVSASYSDDGDRQRLVVEFTSGAQYEYSNVQPHQMGELAAAPSAGSWVRAVLVKQPTAYPCVKLREKAPPGDGKLERYESALQLIASATEITASTPTVLARCVTLAQEALK